MFTNGVENTSTVLMQIKGFFTESFFCSALPVFSPRREWPNAVVKNMGHFFDHPSVVQLVLWSSDDVDLQPWHLRFFVHRPRSGPWIFHVRTVHSEQVYDLSPKQIKYWNVEIIFLVRPVSNAVADLIMN